MSEGHNELLIDITADIVAAYVSKNSISSHELPNLIAQIHNTLVSLGTVTAVAEPAARQEPAVNPKKSVADEHITCLEDGKKFKSLKRHLMTHHGLSPEDYRAKWNLPADYPMVAPGYSKARSALAKEMGLGRKQGDKVTKK